MNEIQYLVDAHLPTQRLRELFEAVGWIDEARVPERNLDQAFNRDTVTASAWAGDELVGFVRGKIDGIYVFLTNLVVHPSAQGQGVGPELFRRVVVEAHDVPGVFAIVGLGTVGQEDFYARYGLYPAPNVIAISNKQNL